MIRLGLPAEAHYRRLGISAAIPAHAVFGIEDDGFHSVAIEKQRQKEADGTAADDSHRARQFRIIPRHVSHYVEVCAICQSSTVDEIPF
jgi:hypothetical protein